MRTVSCTVEKDEKYEICAKAVCCGPDVNISICGGTRHHIGAVAIAFGCMPDGSAPKYSPSVSSIACLNHKDDQVARMAAVQIAAALDTTVTVTAGIHIDDAAPEELDILLGNTQACIDDLISLLRTQE